MARVHAQGHTASIEAATGTGLSVPQLKFVKGLADGLSGTEAVRAAGYAPERAAVKANQLLKNDQVRAALRAELEARGLTLARFAEKLDEGLESRQHGLTALGEVVDMGPDNHARAKFFDMGMKVIGGYPDPKQDQTINAGAIVVIRAEDSLAVSDPFGADVVDVTPREVKGE